MSTKQLLIKFCQTYRSGQRSRRHILGYDYDTQTLFRSNYSPNLGTVQEEVSPEIFVDLLTELAENASEKGYHVVIEVEQKD